MPKFSRSEREQIIRSLVESEYGRRSLAEIASFVKEKIGVEISQNYFSTLRNQITCKGRPYISLLAKNRDTYVSEYLTLIEGAKFSEDELYKLAWILIPPYRKG